MEIFQRFKTFTNGPVAWYANWSAVIGAGWLCLTWIASYWDAIYQQGWGAVILAGLGATCLLLIAACSAMSAWRYFYPLPVRLHEPLADMIKPGEGPINTVSIYSVDSTIEIMGRQLTDLVKAQKQCDTDLIHLLDAVVDQVTILHLWRTARLLPHSLSPTPLESNPELFNEEQMFLRKARSAVAGSYREAELLSILHRAESQAEESVRNINKIGLPADVDILNLPKWEISRIQCFHAVEYFVRARTDVEDRLLSQRTRLIERLRTRAPL